MGSLSNHIAVIVAGSWGTALATVLADNHHDVIMWSRNEDQVHEINTTHTNNRYLHQSILSPRITATTSLQHAIEGASTVLLVAPSSGMRDVARAILPFVRSDMLIVHGTKGFETDSLQRMTEVLADIWPHIDHRKIVVLSGPSHAEEVIRKCPTTVVVAAADLHSAQKAQDIFMNAYFRVYTNSDVVGVELAGSLKNIIAIGAGLIDGLGFGDNAKAALMTRGLAEISRLGNAMGANPHTFAGLSGIGDLIVTCTSKHSRNWRAGHMLAQDVSLEQVITQMGMVIEGIKTTKAAYQLSVKHQIDMPITRELYHVLFEHKSPKHAVQDLMGRIRTHEIEEI